jgi:hypothetical protein
LHPLSTPRVALVTRLIPSAGLGSVLLVALGCGSSGPGPAISVPSYDPDAAARDAVKQLDKNNDGAIDGAELDAAPGLKAAFGGKKVTADALRARIDTYSKSSAGAIGYTVQVTFRDQPLAGATVTFTPEPFLAGVLKPATGTTDAGGVVSSFTVGSDSLPGLAPGMYRVAVSKAGTDIPAAFGAQGSLGCEVSGGRGGSGSLDVKIPGR